MNRFVSLLLVPLSLAAVSLARPAQAQWVKGLPYYGRDNTQSKSSLTTITSDPIGTIKIASTTGNDSSTYENSGSYSGKVGVYYVWNGGALTQKMTLNTTQTLQVTGSGTGSGNSHAGTVSGDSRSEYGGWNHTASPPFVNTYTAGVTPPSVNQEVLLSGGTLVTYPNARTVTATVTFGDPVTTYP